MSTTPDPVDAREAAVLVAADIDPATATLGERRLARRVVAEADQHLALLDEMRRLTQMTEADACFR